MAPSAGGWYCASVVAALSMSDLLWPPSDAPFSSSDVANNASADEQGAVQGLITGVRSLCNGLGPALFGVLFQVPPPHTHHELAHSVGHCCVLFFLADSVRA
jgi:hypothetical protein